MRKYYQKAIALICVLIFSASLSACGVKKETNASNITKVTVWSGNTSGKQLDESLVEKFNKSIGKEKGIYIDYVIKEGGTITQNVELALQTGQGPDLFPAGDIPTLAEKGYLLALNDISGSEELLNRYDENLLKHERFSYKSKIYTVPYSSTIQGLIYNKDMFRAAGIVDKNGEPTPPKTFKELREYAKKLTNTAKNEYGIILPLKWAGWFGSDIEGPMMSSVGHKGFNPKIGKYDYSGLAPIMETFVAMKADKSIYPGGEGLDNDPARALFAGGGIGMKFAFSFDIAVFKTQFPADFDWGIAPYPVVDENNKYKQRMSVGRSYVINANALDKIPDDKLLTVYDFFCNDDMVKETYKEQTQIPVSFETVKDVKLDTADTQWIDACELTNISAAEPEAPKSNMEGQRTLESRFREDVWTGKVSAKEMLEEYTKVINDATQKYYEEHKDESIDRYIIEDYNIKR